MHKGMHKGLQEVLGEGSGKSMDRVLLWGLLGQRNLRQGGLVREGLSEAAMFELRP